MENKKIKRITMSDGTSLDLDIANTVLVLNEYQKQWTMKSLYHKMIKGELRKRNVIDNVHTLIKFWRTKKLPIIHAPIIQDPKNKKGFLAHISNAGFFTKDTWKSEFTEGCYKDGDIILKGRYTFNVFEGSDFDEILQKMKVKTFLICGFTTSLCIKQTVNAAARKGYNFIIINDCSATFNGTLQKMFDRTFKSNITTSEKLMSEIS